MNARWRSLLILLGVVAVGGAVLTWAWPTIAQTGKGGTEFAADREPTTARGGPVVSITFDRERAMQYLRDICALGARFSGSAGFLKQVDLLEQHFTSHGATVERQKFEARQRSVPRPVTMINLIARWNPQAKRRIIICTHYDTRPIADQEPNRNDWSRTFVGANDGGSGVAWMMEMAHHMKDLDLHVGVDFVCFDGEEFIFDNRPAEIGGDKYFFGSEYFALTYANTLRSDPAAPRYLGAVLLDMIAGPNVKFFYEQHSYDTSGKLLQDIWTIAKEVKATAFVPRFGQAVLDDHLALQRVGIPAIDIVPTTERFENRVFISYPHWHRLTDVPENCHPDGLEQVARVLTVWMQRVR
jgi:hypothetical protein